MNLQNEEFTSFEQGSVKRPQSITEVYLEFTKGLSFGENPLFANSPSGSVFCNLVGEEKQLLFVNDENGKVKEWLSEEELQLAIEKAGDVKMTEEQLFDMFSFMIGSKRPSLKDLRVDRWIDLLDGANKEGLDDAGDYIAKIRKVLDFIDRNPKTTLNYSLSDILNFGKIKIDKYELVGDDGKKEEVVVYGVNSWNRRKISIFNNIRNERSKIQQFSPFKSDGGKNIGDIFDLQIIHQEKDGLKIFRLNKIVFLMARHGLAEERTDETSLDQIYITPSEYLNLLWIEDAETRTRQHEIENQNFVICNNLPGADALIEERKTSAWSTLVLMAKEGKFDAVINNIDKQSS